jgi:hypothetical protein
MWGGMRLVHLVHRLIVGPLNQPKMINEYEIVGGMRIGKAKQRKSATVPFHSP